MTSIPLNKTMRVKEKRNLEPIGEGFSFNSPDKYTSRGKKKKKNILNKLIKASLHFVVVAL
jgi:hypothetical protein